MVEAVLLAVSTGPYCLVSCAPVALPFLFAEEMSGKQNAQYVTLFLVGRIVGYLLFAVLLWIVGRVLFSSLTSTGGQVAHTIIYLVLGILMVTSGIAYAFPGKKVCAMAGVNRQVRRKAAIFGFLTGLNLCPPFLAAAARVLEKANLGWGIAFFLPFFGVFWVQRYLVQIRSVSRIVLILVGVFYFFAYGIVPLLRILA